MAIELVRKTTSSTSGGEFSTPTSGASSMAGDKIFTGKIGLGTATIPPGAFAIDMSEGGYGFSLSDGAVAENTFRVGQIGTGSSVIVGKTASGNSVRALSLYAMTDDVDTGGDMVFDIRKFDNTAHVNTSFDAYRFRVGTGTSIMSATRAGAWVLGPTNFSSAHRINGSIGMPAQLGGTPNQNFVILNKTTGAVGAGTYTADVTLPGTTTHYAQGTVVIGGNAFNGSNPIRSQFAVGGRMDLGLIFQTIVNTLPAGVSSITITQPSTFVIRVTVVTTAPSIDFNISFIGSVGAA